MADDEEEQENELLALASIYDERTLVRSPDEKGGQLNAFLDLPVPFSVKIYAAHIPHSLRKNSNKATSSEVKPGDGDNTAGNDNCFETTEVGYLPPIVINFELPKDYPSAEPPNFTLSCKWLTRVQLSKLCKMMDEMWEEQGPGQVILFCWLQFLMDEVFKVLNLKSPMKLHFTKKRGTKSQVDVRAIQDVGSYSKMAAAVLDYDREETERVFQNSPFSCDVCMNEKLGSYCMKFHGCEHVFCCECMAKYFTVQIKDGAVKALTCPESKCESQAMQSQVKSLVSPELFAKYDKFLLQSSLDGMSDIVYCPRPNCQSAVLLEKESTMGLCPACQHPFCVFCKRAYHGVSPCSVKSEEFKKLRDTYSASSESEREFLEKRYGRKTLKHILEEVVSTEWIKDNSKKCPKCRYSIQKVDGCNKMTCTKCMNHFCWLCSALLPQGSPYVHFNAVDGGCFGRLFEGVVEIDDDEDFDEDWF